MADSTRSTFMQRLFRCSTGRLSNRYGMFDLSKPSHQFALWFWYKVDYWRDLPWRMRSSMVRLLRRLLARMDGLPYDYDIGWGVMGNEAESLRDQVAIHLVCLYQPDDPRYEDAIALSKDVNRLAAIAGANWIWEGERRSAMSLSQTVTWIPVGERLPEDAGYRQVAVRTGAVFEARFIGYRGVWKNMSGQEIPSITHWAEPLRHPSEVKEGA